MDALFCPACGGRRFRPSVLVTDVRNEIRVRRTFVFDRLRRKAEPGELKDLVDFMHGFPAPLVECSHCGVLVRGECERKDAGSYEEDPNDLHLMQQVYPRYLAAFRNRKAAYQSLLRPNAEVLELGSHLGAFLQAAEEWHWRPTGLDVGKDTVDFVKRRGLTVRRSLIDDARLPSRTFDAAFLWNVFEQIETPGETLRSVHKVLRPHGLMVLRVPNAEFYRVWRRALPAGEEDNEAVRVLAYNNLLGFPYLYGYSSDSLQRLAVRNGFQPVYAFNSELVTMPFADPSDGIVQEQQRASATVAKWAAGAVAGPWIELVFRKRDEERLGTPVTFLQTARRSFLPRAA